MNNRFIISVLVLVVLGGLAWWGFQSMGTKRSVPSALTADVVSGSAPLTVTFTPRFMGMGNHWIEFGDGTRAEPTCTAKPDTDGCVGKNMNPLTHTYGDPGTYTATYYEQVVGPQRVRGEVTVSVR